MSGRRQKIAFPFSSQTWFRKSGGTTQYGKAVFEPRLLTTDQLGDQDHPWPPPRGFKGDIGGSLAIVKRSAQLWHNAPKVISSPPIAGNIYELSGDLSPLALPSGLQFPSPAPLSNGELAAWGATGFARTIPTRPESEIATMLGEFSIEGIPRDPREMAQRWRDTAARFKRSFESSGNRSGWMQRAREGRRYANDVGGAHLAVAFTWFPFLSEVVNMTNVYLDRAKIIAQFERDSGRLVRRRRVLDDRRWSGASTKETNRYPWPSGASYLWSAGGELTTHLQYHRKVWFSGAYTYYVRFPGAGLLHSEGAQLRNRLFGDRITPSMLWNIAPWSWLIDYGTNIGDVMTNMSQFSRDNLVARHAYVMCHTTVTRTVQLRNAQPRNGSPIDCTLVTRTETKQRARGNPYAFALTPTPLTARQTAILAALGLTRL